jgi:hypothetical protein
VYFGFRRMSLTLDLLQQPRARRPPGGLGGGCFTRSWFSKSAIRDSLRGFPRVRVPERLGLVAIAGLADVPAFAHVGAQTAPRLFEGVQDLVLGDRLVDPALEDPLGPAA